VSVKFQDYYATLGVDRSATREQIQSAYRKLARKHHPDVDKTPGATQRFAQIGEAYEVLKNEKTRKRYDALGARWKEGEEFTPPPGWENARSTRGGDREGFQTFEFDGGDGFSSFFEALFGNAAGPPVSAERDDGAPSAGRGSGNRSKAPWRSSSRTPTPARRRR
jgi:curved DNA-binding protein